MSKKTFGVGLIVVGGLLAAAALANMNAAHLPTSVTSKIPVVPTGKNKYNLGIGLAVAAVGFYLKY
jgi:hypothetical protein